MMAGQNWLSTSPLRGGRGPERVEGGAGGGNDCDTLHVGTPTTLRVDPPLKGEGV